MTAPNLLAVVCALDPAHPEKVTLIFDEAITSAAYGTGLSMRFNSADLPLVSVAQGTDTHQIIATLGGGPPYNTILDITYDASSGDWAGGTGDVASFSQHAVTNASKVGSPDSDYPLSSVISEKVMASGGVLIAQVTTDLNTVDASLVDKYEDQLVDFGGTFGVTEDNEAGLVILQDLKPLRDGMVVKKNFYISTHPDWAAVAAVEWESTMQARISTALSNLRTIDSGVVYNSRVITQV